MSALAHALAARIDAHRARGGSVAWQRNASDGWTEPMEPASRTQPAQRVSLENTAFRNRLESRSDAARGLSWHRGQPEHPNPFPRLWIVEAILWVALCLAIGAMVVVL